MTKKAWALFIILLITLSLMFLGAGARWWEATIPPEPIVIEKTVYVEVPKIEYRDRIIEKPIYIETIKEVPIAPRWFESEQELKTWLSKYPTYGGLDCDDLQEMLMFDAFRDGFIITPIPVFYGKVFDEPVLNVGISGVIDFGAWTWIGNSLYFVDLRLRLPHYKKLSYTRD